MRDLPHEVSRDAGWHRGFFLLFLRRFGERWATCNGNGNGNRNCNCNCNCNCGAKAGLQARVALGRHGWVGGTRCKYVHVSSCVAIHGNTRSRQPTRAYPLTGRWCATKEPAPAAPLHWLALFALFALFGLLGLLVRLICVTFSDRVAAPCPSAAWLYFAMATSQLSGAWGVWVGGTVVPHGCGSRAPMDGFTARPANPHTPRLAQSSEKLCALGVAL